VSQPASTHPMHHPKNPPEPAAPTTITPSKKSCFGIFFFWDGMKPYSGQSFEFIDFLWFSFPFKNFSFYFSVLCGFVSSLCDLFVFLFFLFFSILCL